jgi:alanine-glyoxylate transaminase/serine-glyoxylate transaminase/serine-pyruvate transaminase
MLFEEGLDNVFARHHRLAEGVRCAVGAWGLTLVAKEPKWHSDTVSAIYLPEGFNGNDMVKLAYLRYGLSLGVGLSKIAGKIFRIGHLGDLNELMLMSALAGSEMAMRDIGVQIEPGSGVAAAEEYYRSTAKPVDLSAAAAAAM